MASASASKSFGESARGALSPTDVKALSKVRWVERLKSLWAPVTVLALVFLVYLTIVEARVCAYVGLQFPMKVFGLLCVLWWAALVGLRYLHKPWERLRLARHEAEELFGEVENAANKHRALLKEHAWADLVEASSKVARELPSSNAEALEGSTRKLSELNDKHLVKLKQAAWLETGSGLGKALAVALLVRTVFLEPFKIPSGSMLPTLEIGDQVFVNKFMYGVRLPFTNTVPFVILRPPKRGDVIVFNNPVAPDKDYIKRIVATGGDTLTFKGREIRVNGEIVRADLTAPNHTVWDQRYQQSHPRMWFTDDWFLTQSTLLSEDLSGVRHWILNDPLRPKDRDGEVKVPDGHVFVMGDNRDNSEDSRFGLGGGSGDWEFVPHGHIKGKATVIWLALGRGGLLSSVFGGTGFRTDRLFLPMELCGGEGEPPTPQ